MLAPLCVFPTKSEASLPSTWIKGPTGQSVPQSSRRHRQLYFVDQNEARLSASPWRLERESMSDQIEPPTNIHTYTLRDQRCSVQDHGRGSLIAGARRVDD